MNYMWSVNGGTIYLRLRIHDIQKCFLVVEPGRKRFVQRIIDIFHIKCRYFLPGVLYFGNGGILRIEENF